jgi:hypothetical protein
LRSKALLKPDQLDKRVKHELGIATLETPIPLVERLRGFNKYYTPLASLRKLAASRTNGCTIEDGLLFYRGRLVVLDVDNVRIDLVREAYV